jgi:predicted permease
MDAALHALNSVLVLFLLGAVGYVLAARGWFGEDTKADLPRLVMEVSLPPYLMYVMLTTLTREGLLDMLYGGILPLAALVLTFALARVFVRLLKVPEGRKGIFSVAFTCPNTIYLGIPVNLSLFGPEALKYVLLFYFVHTVFFWTAGNWLIANDGGAGQGALRLRSLISPPMAGFLVGMALLLCDLTPPPFVMRAAESLGSVTTPVILLSLGITLQGMRRHSLRITRELAFILLGRFFFSPAIMIAVSSMLPIPTLMRQVFVIQSGLPVITSIAAMAAYHKAGAEFSAVAVALSTLLCLVTLPVFMVLVSLPG